jgi:hypothetical protein
MGKENQSIAAQASLLPGLQYAADLAIDALNDARAILRMPALHLANMQSVAQDRNQVQSINEAPKQRHTRKRRKLSKEARKKLAASTRERWDVVRAAGIKMKGTVPTAAEVERGRKILERRKTKTTKAKPVRAKGRKAAEPTAAAA